MPTRPRPSERSSFPAPVVALAAWLVPGAGYWLIGQRARGVTVGVVILFLFAAGLLIGGIRVVDPPDFPERSNPLTQMLQKPWYIGQVLTGPTGLVTGYLSKTLTDAVVDEQGNVVRDARGNPRQAPLPASHARSSEIGTLYTAVAGMLNLMAVIDAAYRAGRRDEPGDEDGVAVAAKPAAR